MTNSAPALTTPITYQVPDSAVEIVLHYTDTGLPRVETREVGRIVEEWTCTYATEAEARAAARRAAVAFKAHKSVAGIERRRAELVWTCNHSRNPAAVYAADAEYDLLRDLDDRLPELLADVTNFLEAA